jgi:hypothetical protein
MTELDLARLQELSDALLAGLDRYRNEAARAVAAPVSGTSADGRVVVRVNGAGALIGLELRDGVIRNHDRTSLGELVTRTVRETQVRARTDCERVLARIELPELAAAHEETQRLWRDC